MSKVIRPMIQDSATLCYKGRTIFIKSTEDKVVFELRSARLLRNDYHPQVTVRLHHNPSSKKILDWFPFTG